MRAPLRVVVLVSGEGTTVDGVAEALASDPGDVQIVAVISDRPHARALERARHRGLPTAVVEVDPAASLAWAERLTEAIASYRADLVVLAGFLSILPASWIERWRGRAVNLHPSLLPRYGGRGMYGRRVHAAVLAAGETESGATLHLVTGAVDGGPAVAQTRIVVRPDDTPDSLRDRLRPAEVALLAGTLRRFARGELPLPYPSAADRSRARPAPERPE